MALIKCPECGGTVSDSATTCPHCGYPLKKKTNTTVRIKINAPELSTCTIKMRRANSTQYDTVWTGSYGSIATLHINKPEQIVVDQFMGGGVGTTTIEPGKSYQVVRRNYNLFQSHLVLEEIDLAI